MKTNMIFELGTCRVLVFVCYENSPSVLVCIYCRVICGLCNYRRKPNVYEGFVGFLYLFANGFYFYCVCCRE